MPMAKSKSGLLRQALVLTGPWHNLLLAWTSCRAPCMFVLLLLVLSGSGVMSDEFRGVAQSGIGLGNRWEAEGIRSAEDSGLNGYGSNGDNGSFVVHRTSDGSAATRASGIYSNNINVDSSIANSESSGNDISLNNDTNVDSSNSSKSLSSSASAISSSSASISENLSNSSRSSLRNSTSSDISLRNGTSSYSSYSRIDSSSHSNSLRSPNTISSRSSNRNAIKGIDKGSLSNNRISSLKRNNFRTSLNIAIGNASDDSFLYNLLPHQRFRRSKGLVDAGDNVEAAIEGVFEADARENSRQSSESYYNRNDTAILEDSHSSARDHEREDAAADIETDYQGLRHKYHAQVESHSESEPNLGADTSNLFQNNADDDFKQRMLLKMLRLDRIPNFRPEVAGTMPRQAVPEYVQALLHALDQTEREDSSGLERLRDAEVDDQSIWAIKPFLVLQKDSSIFEALFHISLSYQPSVMSKVELVLENNSEMPYFDSHASFRADPGSWAEFLDYAQRRKAARSARWSTRSTCSIEVCDGKQEGNVNHLDQKTYVEQDFVEKVMVSKVLRHSLVETSRDSAGEMYEASLKLSEKGSGSTTHGLVESSGVLGRILTRSRDNRTMDSPENRSQMSVSPDAARSDKISTGRTTEEKCTNELSTRRRRLVGLDSDHDVLDVTKPFLSWWRDCSTNVKCHNSNTTCLNTTCTVRLKVTDLTSGDPAGLGNNALLIIYKNLEADLSRTRRALRNLAAAAKRVRRSVAEEVGQVGVMVSDSKRVGRWSEIENEKRFRAKRDISRRTGDDSFKTELDSSYETKHDGLKKKMHDISKTVDATLETSRDMSARTRHHIAKRTRRDASSANRHETVEETGDDASIMPRYRTSEKLRHGAPARTSRDINEKASYDVLNRMKRDEFFAKKSSGKEDTKDKNNSFKSPSHGSTDSQSKSSEHPKLESLSEINSTTSRGKRIVPLPGRAEEESRRCEKSRTCTMNKRNAVHIPTSKSSASDPSEGYCGLRQWRIDFEELGWNFVIAPNTVEVNYCEGSCIVAPGYLDAVNLTNNAFLRLVYRLAKERGKSGSGKEGLGSVLGQPAIPSCVPVNTAAVKMLYRQDDNTIVLKMVNEMTATHCGCL